MAIILFLFWLMLNGRLDADVLITGAFATLFGMLFALKFAGWSIKKEIYLYLGLPAAFMYLAALFMEIVRANIEVLKLVFSGACDPCVRTFRTDLRTNLARVALADSITLTPGTVTAEIVGDRLTVHCLSKRMADTLADSALEKRLMRMEEKILGKRV